MLRVNSLIGFGAVRPAATGGGFDADAQAFIDAAGITDTTQKNAINALVVSLKANGIWAKCNAIYPFVGGTAATHKWNLKDPRDLDAAFRIVWTGTVTHDANGITGDGSTGRGDTKLLPSSVLTLYSTHMAIYCRTTGGAAEGMLEIGSHVSGNTRVMYLGARFSGNAEATQYQTSVGGDTVSVVNSDGKGFYISSVISNVSHKLYKNGSSIGSDTSLNATGSLPNTTNFWICVRNFNNNPLNFSNRNLAFASIGSGLTDTEAANFHTAVETYQDALGRGVVA